MEDVEGCDELDFAEGCCAKTSTERKSAAHKASVASRLCFVFSLKLLFITSFSVNSQTRKGTLPFKQFALLYLKLLIQFQQVRQIQHEGECPVA